jgi:very-short-patch-repair endonuclease
VAFVQRHELPLPEVNRRVAGHEVDVLWRAQRLIVELDGYAFHRDRRAFEHDRDRDADVLAAGYSVIRITWQRLTQRPDREARRLRGLLSAAGLRCEPVPVAAKRL